MICKRHSSLFQSFFFPAYAREKGPGGGEDGGKGGEPHLVVIKVLFW